ncbi:glycosyltransferase family 4 protein [Vibrio coralliirubri]|uniref:glycosyltransferase family 4 protein n=1 Tax=Vibrio coralliirubri TaxID=1516159 RepID=UPI00076A677F|nr:glycosyltransferase family 4 protein [Vibrio coralliirubri]
MKIIYLHQYFKKPSMSGGVRSYEFARRLVRDGHDVILVTSDTKNRFKSWKIENIDGIEVHWISVPYDNSYGVFSRLWAFFKFIFLATIHCAKIECDKVFATSTPLTIVIPAILIKKIKGVPYLFEVRDVWPEVPIALGIINNKLLRCAALWLEKLAYRNASSIIALSTDMKKSILSRFPNSKVKVIPNAADIELFDISKSDNNKDLVTSLKRIKNKHEFIVFYTGTFGLVNNLSYIIDLASYSNGKVGFVIVGDGREKSSLEELAKKKGVLDSVLYFLGPVKKSELYIFHKYGDIACSTVLPIEELYANSANKVFDAFAAGTPILINHGGWISELIDKTKCGIQLDETPSKKEFEDLYSYLSDRESLEKGRASSKLLGGSLYNRDILYAEFLKSIEGN